MKHASATQNNVLIFACFLWKTAYFKSLKEIVETIWDGKKKSLSFTDLWGKNVFIAVEGKYLNIFRRYARCVVFFLERAFVSSALVQKSKGNSYEVSKKMSSRSQIGEEKNLLNSEEYKWLGWVYMQHRGKCKHIVSGSLLCILKSSLLFKIYVYIQTHQVIDCWNSAQQVEFLWKLRIWLDCPQQSTRTSYLLIG